MSCITPVPLGWACPPASFASKPGGTVYVISLAVPTRAIIHYTYGDVT